MNPDPPSPETITLSSDDEDVYQWSNRTLRVMKKKNKDIEKRYYVVQHDRRVAEYKNASVTNSANKPDASTARCRPKRVERNVSRYPREWDRGKSGDWEPHSPKAFAFKNYRKSPGFPKPQGWSAPGSYAGGYGGQGYGHNQGGYGDYGYGGGYGSAYGGGYGSGYDYSGWNYGQGETGGYGGYERKNRRRETSPRYDRIYRRDNISQSKVEEEDDDDGIFASADQSKWKINDERSTTQKSINKNYGGHNKKEAKVNHPIGSDDGVWSTVEEGKMRSGEDFEGSKEHVK